MQYEVTFIGGPKDGQKTIYGQSVIGSLYAVKYETEGQWHYYRLCVRGTCNVPDHYEYLGKTSAIICGLDEAREHFANLQLPA